MKKLMILFFVASLSACDSTQKGDGNYSDTAQSKSDTTNVPYTTTPSDSTTPDSTVKDSPYHK